MQYLADVNVWLNAVSAIQPHFPASAAWFESLRKDQVKFCRITMLGMLRLLTNQYAMRGHPVTTDKAWELYTTLREDSRIGFLQEPETIEAEFRRLLPVRTLGGADWTDFYLAAFAVASGSTLVTFDKGFRRFSMLQVVVLGD